jgi:hypothetical protein
MKAWSNKTRVKGAILFAQRELLRTEKTSFEVWKSEEPGKLVMERAFSLKDKMVMGALLAIEEIQLGSNATYRLERGSKQDEIVIFASYKMGPGSILRDSEKRIFGKFGLKLKEGIRVDGDGIKRLSELGLENGKDYDEGHEEARVLFFKPKDAMDLLRA